MLHQNSCCDCFGCLYFVWKMESEVETVAFKVKNYASPLQPAFQNTNAKHFYRMASSLQVFAVKLMTSMQTVGDCGKLLAITTIPERILVQKCIMHCGQFQTSNCSNLQKTTSSGIHTFHSMLGSCQMDTNGSKPVWRRPNLHSVNGYWGVQFSRSLWLSHCSLS